MESQHPRSRSDTGADPEALIHAAVRHSHVSLCIGRTHELEKRSRTEPHYLLLPYIERARTSSDPTMPALGFSAAQYLVASYGRYCGQGTIHCCFTPIRLASRVRLESRRNEPFESLRSLVCYTSPHVNVLLTPFGSQLMERMFARQQSASHADMALSVRFLFTICHRF